MDTTVSPLGSFTPQSGMIPPTPKRSFPRRIALVVALILVLLIVLAIAFLSKKEVVNRLSVEEKNALLETVGDTEPAKVYSDDEKQAILQKLQVQEQASTAPTQAN